MQATAPSVLHLATELLEAHQFGAAIALCASAIDAGADDAPTRLVMTRALLATNRVSEARLHLSRCAEIDPSCAETFRLLATVANRYHDFRAARLFRREATQLELQSARGREIETHQKLATDTWDGTTIERRFASPANAQTFERRRTPRAATSRERTRRVRRARAFALGTALGDSNRFAMETSREAGVFRQ